MNRPDKLALKLMRFEEILLSATATFQSFYEIQFPPRLQALLLSI